MTIKTITMRTTEVGAEGETLEAGATYELSATSADHWLKRDKAVLVEDGTKAPTSKKVTTPKAVKAELTKEQEGAEAAAALAASIPNPAELREQEAKEKAAIAKAAETPPPEPRPQIEQTTDALRADTSKAAPKK